MSLQKLAPRKLSDLLGERRACLHSLDLGPVPKIKQLARHAERYGTDQIVETAAELGYDEVSCVRLLDACDRIAGAHVRKQRPNARAPRIGLSEDRVRALLGVEVE